jgi:hypothetical protein
MGFCVLGRNFATSLCFIVHCICKVQMKHGTDETSVRDGESDTQLFSID